MKKLTTEDRFKHVWNSFHRLRKCFDLQASYDIIDAELALLNSRIKKLGEHLKNKEFMNNLTRMLKVEKKEQQHKERNDNNEKR